MLGLKSVEIGKVHGFLSKTTDVDLSGEITATLIFSPLSSSFHIFSKKSFGIT